MWSDRRKFLTGVACAGLAWIFHRFAGPHVLCVPTNTVLSPLTGELVAVGEVALVRISTGDTISVRLWLTRPVPGSSAAPGRLPGCVPIRRVGREIQPHAHIVGQWVRTVPELEQEPRQAVAYGSPAALYPGVEGASQRVGSVRHERFSNRDRTRGSDLRGRRGESRNVSGPAIRRTNSF